MTEIDPAYAWQQAISNHPIETDDNGVQRYRKDPVISWIIDQINLNDLWVHFAHDSKNWATLMDLYRKMGYSVGGFDEIWGHRLLEKLS